MWRKPLFFFVCLYFKGCIINYGGWKVEEISTAGGRKGLCHGARTSLESTLPLVWSKPVLAQAGELGFFRHFEQPNLSSGTRCNLLQSPPPSSCVLKSKVGKKAASRLALEGKLWMFFCGCCGKAGVLQHNPRGFWQQGRKCCWCLLKAHKSKSEVNLKGFCHQNSHLKKL